MKRLLSLAWLAIVAALPFPGSAQAQRAEYDALVAAHARANGVPEALVHRVIVLTQLDQRVPVDRSVAEALAAEGLA